MRPTTHVAVVLALALAAVGCDGGTTEPPIELPVPGTLQLVLATPNDGDGALRLRTWAGPGLEITAVRAAGTGRTVHLRTEADGRTVAAVFGGLQDGATLLEVDVSDVRTPSRLQASVLEVAGADYALRATTGYTLTAVRRDP